jgi:hypothetical protein
MKLKEYFSNYIILSYDESNDRIIVNSQKLGQTYISKYLPGLHLERIVEGARDKHRIKWKGDAYHPFEEQDRTWSEFLDMTGCKDIEDIFSKDLHFVVRHPKKRFFSGITELVSQSLKTHDIWSEGSRFRDDIDWYKFLSSSEGQDLMKNEMLDKDIEHYDDVHIYPILDWINYIWKDNYKIIDLKDLSNWVGSTEPRIELGELRGTHFNNKSSIYSDWLEDESHPIQKLLLQYNDIYIKELNAWQNLKKY